MAAPLMNEVARDYVTDGVPPSGVHEIRKQDLRAWGSWIEQIVGAFTSNGGLIYSSKALLDADLAKDANRMAWVLGDPVAANNGVYRKIGASGTGSWTRASDLPFSFIVASDVGAGTPNAIQATTTMPVSGSALVLLSIFEENTASPVTVSFNGETALTVKSNSGNDIAAGGLVSEMIVLGVVSGETFRLVSDQASAAILAGSEQNALLAQSWAEGTEPGGAGTKSAREYALEAASYTGDLIPELVTASSYVPVLADATNKIKRLSDATGVALTIPTDASVAFDLGTILTFEQAGAGQITVTGASGVTVRVPSGVLAKSASEGAVLQAIKMGANLWVLLGALESSQIGYLLGSVQTFLSSGTWTKPAGCRAVKIRMVGGGGSGAGVSGAASSAAAGGGGGAGGYVEKFITSGLGPTETVTVGAGGIAPAAGATNGVAGSGSSFGIHATAAGGNGGTAMTAGTSATTAVGGTGGGGSGGDINVTGGSGDRGARSSGTVAIGARGGDGQMGRGGQNQGNNDGSNGTGYGAGGGGAITISATDRAGGNGTNGIVVVEEYY